MDPRIGIQYGAATNATVANPFYHLTIPNRSPGALWNQATVGVTALARPYAHYGGLTVIDGISGGDMTYHSLQIKATKSFSNGYTLLAGCNYHIQANKVFYDNVDNYLQNWSSLDSATPRQRITGAGTWAVPVGKGRKFLTGAPRLLDALIGGWNLAGLMTYHSGTLLTVGGMVVSGDPHVSNPGPNAWFDKSVFKQLPAFTRRTNPWYYSDIRGPQFINLDGTLNKDFAVTEKIKFQLHMDAFNTLNNIKQHELQQSEHERNQQPVREIHGYLSARFRTPSAAWTASGVLIRDINEALDRIAGVQRIGRKAISALSVLNEAYDYPRPSSFSRGLRIDLNGLTILLISGTASIDENGQTVHAGDFGAQLRRTCRNITELLAAEGATWKDVVRTTCYLRDIERDYDAFNEERTEFFGEQALDPLPASTARQAILCRPELLVEIEAVAMFIPQRGQP